MDYKYFQNKQHRNTHYLSAVGENGSIDISTYADGFYEAAMKLFHVMHLNKTFENKCDFETLPQMGLSLFSKEDIIIYPICFNLRHAIELYLKGVIEHIRTIFQLKAEAAGKGLNESGEAVEITMPSILNFPFTKTGHDLNTLWNFVISLNKNGINANNNVWRTYLFDNRYDAFTNELDEYIKEWGKIDPNGQTFRYPFNSKEQRNLAEVNLISLLQLYESAERFHQKLKDFYQFVAYVLLREYENRQFTEVFTWAELDDLADGLPDFKTWTIDENENFVAYKNACLNRFNVSQKKLALAIDFVKRDYFLSSKIGIQIPLIALRDEETKQILDFFALYTYPEIDDKVDDDNDSFMAELQNRISTESVDANLRSLFYGEEEQAIIDFLNQWEHEKLVDVITLFYLGNGLSNESMYYNEEYRINLSKFREKNELVRKITDKRVVLSHNLKKVLAQLGKAYP